MSIYDDYQDEAEAVIKILMQELSDSYEGVQTLPAEHPAKIAFNKANDFLNEWKR